MANRKRAIPQYGIVTLNGLDYYRTRVQDADGKLVALYARTPEELYDKELNALEQIDNDTFCRKSPTVAEYCEKWLLMAQAGKPTDNPVNEALNGWIKEELFIDFRLEECRTRDAVKDVLCRYVDFYNRQRPCFAIGYDTPDNYCKRFYRGELEKKDTFSKRILTEEPKFVQKRKDTEK